MRNSGRTVINSEKSWATRGYAYDLFLCYIEGATWQRGLWAQSCLLMLLLLLFHHPARTHRKTTTQRSKREKRKQEKPTFGPSPPPPPENRGVLTSIPSLSLRRRPCGKFSLHGRLPPHLAGTTVNRAQGGRSCYYTQSNSMHICSE